MREFARRNAVRVSISWLIAVIYTGEILTVETVEILLAVKLNVFAVPLIVDGVIEFPYWVLYCIVVLWLYSLNQWTFSVHSREEVIEDWRTLKSVLQEYTHTENPKESVQARDDA